MTIPDQVCFGITDNFPEWKQIILKKLGEIYASGGNSFPKDIMKQLKTFCVADPALKPIMKNAMQVAAFFIKKSEDEGKRAFELQVPYNQEQVLKDNMDYITSAIGVKAMVVQYDNESGNAEPGSPTIDFASS